MSAHDLQYIRKTYNVPAAIGGLVTVDGKPGEIRGFRGAYLMVRFDGQKHASPCHPTWKVAYLGPVSDEVQP